MYTPKLGVWMQRDPAADGLNPYEYVGSKPANHVDPAGLAAIAASGVYIHYGPGGRQTAIYDPARAGVPYDSAVEQQVAAFNAAQAASQPASQPATRPTTAPASSVKTSMKGQAFIKSYEKLILYPYSDSDPKTEKSQLKVWGRTATIAWGHLISKSEWPTYKNPITAEGADLLFAQDLKRKAENPINNLVTAKLSTQQYDALASLVFNIGEGAFRSSSVLKLINNPQAKTNYKDLESAWKSWTNARGGISPGLVNRRADEWEMWCNGDYRRDH